MPGASSPGRLRKPPPQASWHPGSHRGQYSDTRRDARSRTGHARQTARPGAPSLVVHDFAVLAQTLLPLERAEFSRQLFERQQREKSAANLPRPALPTGRRSEFLHNAKVDNVAIMSSE